MLVPGAGSPLAGQIGHFLLVGTAVFGVNAALVELLVIGVGPLWAQALAFPLAATLAWWLNRRYTFGASGSSPQREWLHYLLANALGWLLNNGVYLLCVDRFALAALHPSLAVAAGSIAGMVANFLLSRQLVFRGSRSHQDG